MKRKRRALAVGIIPMGGHWMNPLNPRCKICGGELALLGKLGKKKWFRCINCGMEFSKNPSGDFPSTSEYGQTYGEKFTPGLAVDLSKLAEPITKKEAQKLAEQTVEVEEKVAQAETGERYLPKEEREKREKELSQEYLEMAGKGPPMAVPLQHIEFGIPRPQYYVGKALEKWQSRPRKGRQLALFESPKKKSEGGLGGVILVLAIGAMVSVALYYANKDQTPTP